MFTTNNTSTALNINTESRQSQMSLSFVTQIRVCTLDLKTFKIKINFITLWVWVLLSETLKAEWMSRLRCAALSYRLTHNQTERDARHSQRYSTDDEQMEGIGGRGWATDMIRNSNVHWLLRIHSPTIITSYLAICYLHCIQ